MSSLEEHEQRITAVEAELAILRQKAAAARALAAGADRDVSDYRAEIRGLTRMTSALRETQLEHYREHKADSAALRGDSCNELAWVFRRGWAQPSSRPGWRRS